MRSCPQCKAKYPATQRVCTRDGVALVDGGADDRPIDPTASIPPPAGTGELVESRMPRPRAAFTDSEETRWASPGARVRHQPSDYAHGSGPQREETEPGTDPEVPPVSALSSTGARGKRRARSRRQTRPEDRVGKSLGSYRLIEVIGKGGMGSVYRAEHIKLGREVALKLLRADYAERRDSVARFFQEARAVNRIRHRNIVDVTDFVELDDGTTFIIMELLEGEPLSRLMRAGALDTPRILAILVQICDGLAAAHNVGIVHRDMKPDNVLIVPTDDGADLVKLLDFGVAKLLTREDEDVGLETVAGSVIGTPAYLSPEQAGGLEVDGRADLYSVGAIMYELYCGQPPFRGKSFGEFVRKHLSEMPAPPHQTERGKGIDPRIESVILRCLEKRPEDRYPDAATLRDELLGLLSVIETQTGRTDGPPPWGTGEGAARHPLPLSAGPSTPTPAPPYGGYVPTPTPQNLSVPTPAPHVTYVPTPAPMAAGAPSHGGVAAWPQTGIRQGSGKRKWAWAAAAVVIAAGLGISIYVTNTGDGGPEAAAASSTTPSAGPVVTGIGSEGEDLVSVKIISTPPGADVFAFRARDPMTVTPCQLTVNPDDGGPPVRRYVVQKDGFQAEEVTIDLGEKKSEYRFELALERYDSAAPPKPAEDPVPATAAPVAPKNETPAAVGHTSADADEEPPAATGEERATSGEEQRERRQRRRRRRTSPNGSSKDESRGKIAPSDTLNPFGS